MAWTKIRTIGRTVVDYPLVGALPSDRFLLKSVQGLDAPEINNYISNHVFQGSDPVDRQIVMRVGLNPDYATGETVSDLRTVLYGLLSPGAKDYIDFQIMDGTTVIMQTRGYVKRIEAAPFTKDPEALITIDTTSPYFEAPADEVITPGGTNEFPIIDNIGTAPTGFVMHVELLGNMATNWTFGRLGEMGGNSKHRLYFYGVSHGDELKIDTRKGSKSSLSTDPGGINWENNLASTQGYFFDLYPGENLWEVDIFSTYNWMEFRYRPQYWGV